MSVWSLRTEITINIIFIFLDYEWKKYIHTHTYTNELNDIQSESKNCTLGSFQICSILLCPLLYSVLCNSPIYIVFKHLYIFELSVDLLNMDISGLYNEGLHLHFKQAPRLLWRKPSTDNPWRSTGGLH